MRMTILVAFTLALSSSITMVLPARGEVPTEQEMQTVCLNWLADSVQRDGTWAGSSRPSITQARRIFTGQQWVASCYSISPDGYVVVPALKELPPIQAYSDAGDLDLSRTDGLPQLLRKDLKNRFARYQQRYGSLDALQPATGSVLFNRADREEWDRLTAPPKLLAQSPAVKANGGLAEAGPLLTTSWHPTAPYNNLCPMGDGARTRLTGIATAVAQVMNFHQWPPAGVGNYPLPDGFYTWDGDDSCGPLVPGSNLAADFSDPYDWSNMPTECTAGCSTEQEAAVAELCYEVAVALRTDFGKCQSYPSTTTASEVLTTHFRFDPGMIREERDAYTAEDWFGLIRAEIDAGRPMIYGLTGHTVICDGWQDTGGSPQYHINYGWGSPETAWYALDNIACPSTACYTADEYLLRNIKPLHDGACCHECEEGCTDAVSETDCTAAGGTWFDGQACALVTCPAPVDCDDGEFCNGTETCVDGYCQPGIAPCSEPTPVCCADTASCAAECCVDDDCPEDGNACTGDTCDAGVCVYPPHPAGTVCGDPADTDCTAPDTCDGAGTCLDNHMPDDSACSDDGFECTDDICLAGGCTHPNKQVGTPCGDPTDNACTAADSCDGAGECLVNHEPDGTDCADDGSECTDDVCASGVCIHPNREIGTACGDPTDDECTAPDTCDGAGVCLPNHEPDGTGCTEDGNECTDDVCNSGVCIHPGVAQGTACGDPSDSTCDRPDTCDGTGNCDENIEPLGAPCSNGLWCDGDETCDGAGTCQPGVTRCDDGIECTSDSCDEVTDECGEHVPFHEMCDDGDACTGVEYCDTTAGCVSEGPLVCDDEIECTEDSCDPIEGCTYVLLPSGTPCGDPADSTCDHPDTCNGDGECLPNYEPAGTPCPNGLVCDGDEFCNEAGICTPGISLCDDGIACTADLCDEETAVCTSDPVSCGLLELNLHNERTCFSSGQDLCVTIDVRNLYGQDMIGGQFFLEYDACLLDLLAIAPGDHSVPGISPCPTSGLSPFSAEIFKAVSVDGCTGTIAYAVAIPLGEAASAADNTMATLLLSTKPAGAGTGQGSIAFDLDHESPTHLADSLGTQNFPLLGDEIPFIVDDSPPILTCPSDPLPATVDPDACEIAIDPGEPTCTDACNCTTSCSRDDGEDCQSASYPVGVTTLTWTATDEAGNTATCTTTVTVSDEQHPEIECPLDVEQCNDPDQCQAVVFPGSAACTDNCACTVTCSREDSEDCEDDPYPVGPTTLTWTATDPSGNLTTCRQTVIVDDCQAPTVASPPDVEATPDPGECGAHVDPGEPTCEDNCGSCSATCERDDGLDCWNDQYPVGTTTLTWTATDPQGSSATHQQTVVVGGDNILDLIVRSEAAELNGECPRCLSFVLSSCGVPCPGTASETTFAEELTFQNGVASASLDVPYGTWDCLSVKDDLHTLRRTVHLRPAGGQFVADLTAANQLRCGDADNNNVVDITDYAILFRQYLTWPTPVITRCEDELVGPPPPYHADFDCDGIVTTNDFLCILINFLKTGDDPGAGCRTLMYASNLIAEPRGNQTAYRIQPAGVGNLSPAQQQELAGIGHSSATVHDIALTVGMPAAQAADLDGNGILDANDIALFAQDRSITIPDRFLQLMADEATPIDEPVSRKPARPENRR